MEDNIAILNIIGQPCPLPVIAAKKALKEGQPGDRVTIEVDNDIARQNLEKLDVGLGHTAKTLVKDGGLIEVTFTVGQAKTQPATEGHGLTVAIGRETLGAGRDDNLGRALMKSFLQSLTELDVPPEYVFSLTAASSWPPKAQAAWRI